MKKAKALIIPMLALAVLGMASCGEEQSSSQPQSSSSGKASIPVDAIASVEITNKAKLQADWPLNEGSRTLEIKVLDTSGKQLSETVLIATGELKISSSDDSIVTTMGAGIYAKKGGKATITVKVQDKTDSVEVNVVEPKQAQTVAATLQQVANLADGQITESAILTKGIVKEVTAAWDAGYGNISFKIQDAGVENELLCYRVVPAEGIDGSAIKAGDEVTINGKIKNYQGTLEYDAGAVIEAWKDGGIVVQTKTKINEVAAGDKVDLTGRVEAKSKRSAILNDGTGHIFIYGTADAIGAITVGKSYNVKGSTTEKNGAVQVESPVFAEVADVNLAADADTALTAAIADGWKAAGAKFSSADVKLYSWEAVIGKSGSYLTYGIEGSTTNIQAGYAPDEFAGLTEGTHYNIKAYFAGYSGGHSDASQDYANIVILSAEVKAGEVSIKNTLKYVEPEADLQLEVETAGVPSDTYQFVSDHPEFATVDNTGKVHGVAVGKANITATSVAFPEKSATIEITVKNKTAEPENVPATLAEVMANSSSVSNKLYVVEGIWENKGNGLDDYGNGWLTDPLTGDSIQVYGATMTGTAFSWNEWTAKYTFSNPKDAKTSMAGIANGYKVTAKVLYSIYNGTKQVNAVITAKEDAVASQEYPILVDPALEHGTITPSKDAGVKYGEEVTVEVTPDSGYVLKKLYVVNAAGKKTDITEAKKFNASAKNLLTAEFEKADSNVKEIQHTLAAGNLKTEGGTWKPDETHTWTYDAFQYASFDSSNGRGFQIGSGSKPINGSWTISCPISSFGAGVVGVAVESAMASGGDTKVSIKIGETEFLAPTAVTTSNATYTATQLEESAAVTSGNVVITLTNTVKAAYLKSITVYYVAAPTE